MNRRLTMILLAATAVAATWAVVSFACGDKANNTTASVVAARKGECPYAKSARATMADAHIACPHATSTMAAAGKDCPAHGAMVTGSSSTRGGTSATVVSNEIGSCVARSAGMGGACCWDKASGSTASSEGGSCSAHAMAGGSCSAHEATMAGNGGSVTAAPAGSGCAHGAKNATMASRTGCAICDANVMCNESLRTAGAIVQVVPLKNGVMYVYTVNAAGKTHAVQAAVHHRNDRIAEIANAGVDVPLCDGCKAMRGAMASGKLHREVVNIEGGSLTLVTSEDPEIVRAIQEYSGVRNTKS